MGFSLRDDLKQARHLPQNKWEHRRAASGGKGPDREAHAGTCWLGFGNGFYFAGVQVTFSKKDETAHSRLKSCVLQRTVGSPCEKEIRVSAVEVTSLLTARLCFRSLVV